MKNPTEFIGRVKCPYCGYSLPVWYGEKAAASDVWIQCKGKHCKKMIEIKIEKTK